MGGCNLPRISFTNAIWAAGIYLALQVAGLWSKPCPHSFNRTLWRCTSDSRHRREVGARPLRRRNCSRSSMRLNLGPIPWWLENIPKATLREPEKWRFSHLHESTKMPCGAKRSSKLHVNITEEGSGVLRWIVPHASADAQSTLGRYRRKLNVRFLRPCHDLFLSSPIFLVIMPPNGREHAAKNMFNTSCDCLFNTVTLFCCVAKRVIAAAFSWMQL